MLDFRLSEIEKNIPNMISRFLSTEFFITVLSPIIFDFLIKSALKYSTFVAIASIKSF